MPAKKTRTVEATRTEAGWTITARWEIGMGKPTSMGPAEICIKPTGDTIAGKGITSGVMRRFEAHLADMTAEVTGRPRLAKPSDGVRRHVAEQLADMPDSPRKDPGLYYGMLLRAHGYLTSPEGWVSEPVNFLADVLNLPKNTVRTQLATARRKYQSAG